MASATIYADSREQINTESKHQIGRDFSMDVCCKWESVFKQYDFEKTKKIIF